MKVAVLAVGRMKAGPEKALADRYFDRLAKSGPAVGLDFTGVTEFPESRAQSAAERRRDESHRIGAALTDGSALILLDERGKSVSSQVFADILAGLRDDGRKGASLAIGGADGHESMLSERAEFVLSLGALTWPHQLVRILVAEQLYRASTILAGHPYHRS